MKRTRRPKERVNLNEDVGFAPAGLPFRNLNQISAMALDDHPDAFAYFETAMSPTRGESPNYRAVGHVPS